MKDVLFGEEPWVISCYTPDESIQPYLGKAASKLSKADIKVGVIDCKEKTTKGEAIWRRLGLKKSKYLDGGKKLFFVGNGKKTSEISANTARTPEAILAWAGPLAALKIHYPATTTQFYQSCTKKSRCLAIMSDGKASDYDQATIKELAKQHRTTSFAFVNDKQAEITGTGIAEGASFPRVQLFHKPAKGSFTEPAEGEEKGEKIWTRVQTYDGSGLSASSLNSFLGSADPAGGLVVTKMVSLKSRVDPEAAKRKESKRARKRAREKAKREAKKQRAEAMPKKKAPARRKLTIDDEREARRKMDAEMADIVQAEEVPEATEEPAAAGDTMEAEDGEDSEDDADEEDGDDDGAEADEEIMEEDDEAVEEEEEEEIEETEEEE
jgi:hypothetical protein